MTKPLSAPTLPMPDDNINLIKATFSNTVWRGLNRKDDPHWTIHNGRDVLAIVWADDLHSEQETAEKFKRAYRSLDPLVEALKLVCDNVERPPERNCTCHVNPPCSDCVDYGALREMFETIDQALSLAEA